jgi:hypothetical protein
MLFKALFYHCCDDFRHFRTDELPGFFKKSIQDALRDLLKNNADFTESLRLVLGSSEMHQQLSTILRSSPEEFSQLNFEKFPVPLKTLMNTLMKLVYEELQGSLFIAQCVQIIAKGLADGSLKGFIRPPAPVNSSPQSTSEQPATPVVSEAPTSPTSLGAPAVTPPANPPQKTPTPVAPSSNGLSTFVSFFWSVISRIARLINWLLGR